MNSFIKSIIFSLVLVFGISGCSVKNQYDNLEIKSINEIVPTKKEKKMLGIAFGGGGVRGFMHLGVIKALEEEGIKADIITGTSAGSIAASFYASGMDFKKMENLILNLEQSEIGDFTIFGRGGIIQGQKLAKWIRESTNNMQIEDTPIKLGIAVTDLTNAKSLLITKGDIGEASQTSSSIPGGFIPVKSKGNILVDGGVLSLVPVNFNRALGADIVIGVDIYCGKLRKPEEKMLNILVAATRIQSCKISENEIKNGDFIIRPIYEPKSYGNFDSKIESIQVGYEATKNIIPELKQYLNL